MRPLSAKESIRATAAGWSRESGCPDDRGTGTVTGSGMARVSAGAAGRGRASGSL